MVFTEQVSFTSGYVSPRFYNRFDTQAYQTFCDYTNNMYPLVSGGMTRRPGFSYFNSIENPGQNVKLYSFIFNTTQAILIEFGDLYIKFHKSEGTIQSGGSDYSIVSPYTEADLSDLKFAQINDLVYIVHPSYAPAKLTRLADDNWTLEIIEFKEPPYNPINISDTTITANNSGATPTLTSSEPIFDASRDVNRYMRIEVSGGANAGKWVYGKITAVTSTTVVDFSIESDFNLTTTATTLWRFGAFYDGNYPRYTVFQGNRLWLANTAERPATGWGSVLAEFDNFAPSSVTDAGDDNIAADDSILFTISSNKSAAIQFLVDSNTLVIGTESGLFNAPLDRLTPSNFNLQQSSAVPLSDVSPVIVEDTIVAVSKLRNQIFAFRLDASSNSAKYNTEVISVYWEHLLNSKVRKLAFVDYPTPIIWMINDDNTLLSMTYSPSQRVLGVTQHEIDDISIEDLSVLPNTTDGYDELWLQCRLDSNGFIGIMAREYDASLLGEEVATNARFLDAYLEYSGAPIQQLSGLTHLSNKEVRVIADGRVEIKTVDGSGVITLDREASNIAAGLSYISEMKTFDVVSNVGTLRPSQLMGEKQLHGFKVAFFESLYCFAQAVFDRPAPSYNVSVVEPIPKTDNNNAKKLQSTKTERIGLDNETAQEVKVRLWIEDPLPLTITGVFLDITPVGL